MDTILQLDQQLLLSLNGSNSVFWDGFWMTLTHPVTWSLLYFVLFVILVRNSSMRQLVLTLIMVGLVILVADQFASGFCKPYFHRLRPTHEPSLCTKVEVVNGYVGGLYGFISSHAANTFAIATFFTLIIRHRLATVTLFLYAVLASYSRIYLGVHYPSDILCGALWGVLCACLVYLLYRYFNHRLSDQREFSSDFYTATGMQIDDVQLIPLAFSLTLIYAVFRAIFYSFSN